MDKEDRGNKQQEMVKKIQALEHTIAELKNNEANQQSEFT